MAAGVRPPTGERSGAAGAVDTRPLLHPQSASPVDAWLDLLADVIAEELLAEAALGE